MAKFRFYGLITIWPFLVYLFNTAPVFEVPHLVHAVVAQTAADTIPPEAICKEFGVIALDADGSVAMPAAFFNEASNDLGGGPIWLKVRSADSALTCQQQQRLFHNTLTFCCTDIGDTLLVNLRVYDIPTPDSAVLESFGIGHFSDCTMKIVVRDPIKPVFPALPDLIVTCEQYIVNSISMPVVTDICCLDTVYFTDQRITYDTVCKRGTVRRKYTAIDCSGNTATANQNITVLNVQNYAVRFPDDLLLNGCSTFPEFGAPQFWGVNCEDLSATYIDTIVPENVGIGTCFRVKRTWRIINWCTYNAALPLVAVPNPNPDNNPLSVLNYAGPTVAPLGGTPEPTLSKINPGDAAPTDFSQFWQQNGNGYRYVQTIQVYDTQIPDVFLHSPPLACDQTSNNIYLWSGNGWWDPVNQSDNLREAPVGLSIIATDECGGSNLDISYELLLDLDRDDTLETFVNSLSPPIPGTVDFNNLFSFFGQPRSFDTRFITLFQKYKFALQKQVIGDTIIASAKWNSDDFPNQYSNMQLPHGTHTIVWHISDNCGNTTTKSETFTISNDCTPPTIVCLDEIAVDLPLNGDSIVLPFNVMLFTASDNATPASSLEFGVEKAPFGSTFPTQPNGQPNTQITLDCSDTGFRSGQVWVRDQTGNTSTCTINLVVNDPFETCPQPIAAARGAAFTPEGEIVTDIRFDLYRPPIAQPIQSIPNSESGIFQFNDLTPFSSYTVGASRNSALVVNGVTTYDLVLISRHILNVEPFDSPFQLIAADVNGSNTVTTFDIVTARKAILGVIDSFPNGIPSWRFIPQAYQFPIPENPFATAFPERLNLTAINGLIDSALFTAVKIGDVDFSADPAYFAPPADDRQLPVGLTIRYGNIDESGAIPVYIQAKEALSGFQFSLLCADNTLKIKQFIPAFITDEHFALHEERNQLSISWNGDFRPEDGAVLLGYLFISGDKKDQKDCLQLSGPSTTLSAEAYTNNGNSSAQNRSSIELVYTITASHPATIQLTCQPNPFSTTTKIGVYLPDAQSANMQITDAQGRQVFSKKIDHSTGWNWMEFAPDSPNTGIFFVRVESASQVIVNKLIQQPLR